MPISVRLDKETEKKLEKAKAELNISKTAIIKRSLDDFFAKISSSKEPYQKYEEFQGKIPSSNDGTLSISKRKVKEKIRESQL